MAPKYPYLDKKSGRRVVIAAAITHQANISRSLGYFRGVHITAGDSSWNAAVREIREELGISIDINALQFLVTLQRHYHSPDNLIKDNEIFDVYLYLLPVEESDITPDSNEVIRVAYYYPVNQLKNLLIEKRELFSPHEEEYRRLFEMLSALI